MDKHKITTAQAKYLFEILKNESTGLTMAQLSNELGVKRASTHKMVSNLEEMELLIKKSNGDLVLTEQGREITSALDKKLMLMYQFLTNVTDMNKIAAKEDSLIAATTLSDDFFESGLFKALERKEPKEFKPTNKKNKNFLDWWEEGIYSLPFKVMKNDGKQESMGNKGFLHPCRMEINEASCFIKLESKQLYYRSILGKNLRGQLKRLSYWNGEEFVDATAQQNVYPIPIDAIDIYYDEKGRPNVGILKIEAVPTVCIAHMGTSVAVVHFNFLAGKKII